MRRPLWAATSLKETCPNLARLPRRSLSACIPGSAIFNAAHLPSPCKIATKKSTCVRTSAGSGISGIPGRDCRHAADTAAIPTGNTTFAASSQAVEDTAMLPGTTTAAVDRTWDPTCFKLLQLISGLGARLYLLLGSLRRRWRLTRKNQSGLHTTRLLLTHSVGPGVAPDRT